MKRLSLTGAMSVVCLLVFTPALSWQNKVILKNITGPVYMLSGNGGNVGLIADPGERS